MKERIFPSGDSRPASCSKLHDHSVFSSKLTNTYLDHDRMRQCQIRVRFESRNMQFFKVLESGFQ